MIGSVILKVSMVTIAAGSAALLFLTNHDTRQIAEVTSSESNPKIVKLPDPKSGKSDIALLTGIQEGKVDNTVWEEKFETLFDESASRPGEPKLLSIFRLIASNNFDETIRLQNQLKTETAKKIVTWQLYSNKAYDVSVEKLKQFIDENQDWPSQGRLISKVEKKLFEEKQGSEIILDFFKDDSAITPAGRIALARAYGSSGLSDRSKELIVTTWRNDKLNADEEDAILQEFGNFLSDRDHEIRAHRILYEHTTSSVKQAQSALKFVKGAESKKLNVRIAMIKRQKKAKTLLSELTATEKNDPAVVYTTAKWHQKSKRKTQALNLVKAAKPVADDSYIADKWWKLRRYFIYESINSGKPKTAYRIAENYGGVSVNNLNQARFLSGWIALRFLKKPELAKQHFTDLNKSADGPRSRSRSHYWLGRTALVLKKTEVANQHFREGAKYFNTYYGQLSRQTMDPDSTSITLRQPPDLSRETIRKFFRRDSVMAAVISEKNGLQGTKYRFLSRLRFSISDAGELRLLAELSDRLGSKQQVVRIGKRGMFFGYPFENYAYPIDALPEFKPIRPLPERALIYSIARQESEFNPNIVSPAGARGMMQVMPITARHVSRQHKIKYELNRLLRDPAYNCQIASAYIADRMDEFGGSYVKTIAGFNAGPGRVRRWISKFGDPSRPEVDPVDWIERIPFTETRNYVQKVLANLQIYRARLGSPKTALNIRPDLDRGRS